MTKGFLLSVQPLLFGGYVHGPQFPGSLRRGGKIPTAGLMFMGGKRSLPKTPVGEVLIVPTQKNGLADCHVEPLATIKLKPLRTSNKPMTLTPPRAKGPVRHGATRDAPPACSAERLGTGALRTPEDTSSVDSSPVSVVKRSGATTYRGTADPGAGDTRNTRLASKSRRGGRGRVKKS